MSKMTYRKIEVKSAITIDGKKKNLQLIGVAPTGELVFCTDALSVEELKSLCVEAYNFNDAYFPFNVVLRNDLDLVTSIVLDAIERGDFTPNEEQDIALNRLVDATDGVCYPILMDRVDRSYPEMIKKLNAEKMCKDIKKAVEGANDAPDDSKEEDVLQIDSNDEYKVISPRYTTPISKPIIEAKKDKDKSESIEFDPDPEIELELKNMTKVADFMEKYHTFDEDGHIDYYKFAEALIKYGPINLD